MCMYKHISVILAREHLGFFLVHIQLAPVDLRLKIQTSQHGRIPLEDQ